MAKTAFEALDEKYGKNSIKKFEYDKKPIDVISTGSLALDDAIGIRGIPRGRITVIFGPPAGGKTTVSLHTIANAQKTYPELDTAWIDAEQAFDGARAELVGVDVNNLYFSQPNSGEQAWDTVEALLRTNNCSVIVVDSIAMLVPQSEVENDFDKSIVGMTARLTTKAMRKLGPLVAQSNTALLLINQVRNQLSGYGNPETMPGGFALSHGASLIIRVARAEWIKQGEEQIGIVSKAQTTKNRLAAPMKTAEFSIYFDRGISIEHELLTVGLKHAILTKGGMWWRYKGDVIGQGTDNAAKWLKEHPDVGEEIIRAYRNGS